MQEKTTGWAGLAGFAGILMLVVGSFNIIQGFVAFFTPGYYVVNASELLVLSYNSWGFIHLGVGALLLAAGTGVLAGATWARVTGIIIASINAIAQVAFLAAFPVWALLVIALDVLIIYALAVHGGELSEMEAAREETPTEMRRRAA